MAAGKRGKEIERIALDLGWVKVEGSGRGKHVKYRHPDTGQQMCLPGSPGDVRSIKNCEARLRRLAVVVKPPRT